MCTGKNPNIHSNNCYSQAIKQEAQLLLTNRLTLVHTSIPCCAVKSCPLVNDCDLLAWFSDFYLTISHLTPSMREIPSSYQVHICIGKLECHFWWRLYIDSSSGHNTSMWQTQRQTYRQPHRHSKCRSNTLHLAANHNHHLQTWIYQWPFILILFLSAYLLGFKIIQHCWNNSLCSMHIHANNKYPRKLPEAACCNIIN